MEVQELLKPIKLNDNYRIEKDSYSWVLIFNEPRMKLNKKTLESVEFIYEDKWYFPCIKQILRKFIELDLKESSSLDQLIIKMDALDIKINELKNTIFNK